MNRPTQDSTHRKRPRRSHWAERFPASIELLRLLSERPGESLWEAYLNSRHVALRGHETFDDSTTAELRALAALDSPRVAAMAGWGPLDGNGRWVARDWIEGQSFGAFARITDHRASAAALTDAFAALSDVHAAGLVHGDLSPNNIIVDPDGRGWLTDFGLSSTSDGATRGRRAGTPLFIAPEVLVGSPVTTASDIFSMGALLYAALSRRPIDPATFYGRFPAESFVDSTGGSLDDLPEWSRGLVQALTARDPAARPSSAAELARELLERIGSSVDESVNEDRCPTWARGRVAIGPRIKPLAGRRSLVEGVATLPPGLARATVEDPDEVEPVSLALALELALKGRRVCTLELESFAGTSTSTLDLDRRVTAELQRLGLAQQKPSIVIVRIAQDDPWQRAAVDGLAHAALELESIALVVIISKAASSMIRRVDTPWERATALDVPHLPRAAVIECIASELHAETREGDARVAAFSDRVDVLASGSAARANSILGRAMAAGAFVASPVRLAPTYSIESLASTHVSRLPESAGANVRVVLAGVAILDGVAGLHDLALVAINPDGVLRDRVAFDKAVQASIRAGFISDSARQRLRSAIGYIRVSELGVDAATLRTMHAQAAGLRSSPGDLAVAPSITPNAWGHMLCAANRSELHATTERVQRACDELKRCGLYARIARELERARCMLESENRALPTTLLACLARALVRSGAPQRARQIAGLTGRAAIASEVAAIQAHLRGDWTRSAGAFDDAGLHDLAQLERAHHAFARGSLAQAREAAASIGTNDQNDATAVVRIEALTLRALADHRLGELEAAQAALDEALVIATRVDAPMREGTVRYNRAVIARDTGDFEGALTELESARVLYRRIGHAAGEAQIQTLVGGILRGLGKLDDAEQPLASAIARRSRLGDATGAASTRGMLGLLLLERGHLRRAIDELTISLNRLGAAGLSANAALVAAALNLARARIGATSPQTSHEVASSSDARVDEWNAIAGWIRGDIEMSLSRSDDDVAWILDLERSASDLIDRAREHRANGRDARAARLAIEAACRADDPEVRQDATRLARSLLDRAFEGLTDSERTVALVHLLGVPDPKPDSLHVLDDPLDDEMDVVTILELNERLVRQEDTSTLIGAIIEAALEISGAERGFLVLSNDGTLELDTAYDSSRGDLSDEVVNYSRTIVDEALRSRRAMRVSDALEHDEWSAARSVEHLHLRSILASPFYVSPRLSGVIVVDDCTRPGAFGPREERLLNLLAGQAALAIRQVRRLEENRHLTDELRRRVTLQSTQLEEAQRALDQASVVAPVEGLVGESQSMLSVRTLIHRVARADISALITGPSGSGKEVAARAIHALSPRKDRPFVSENCAALPLSLIESELFGSAKGSYTGADTDRAGLFERADGGTLFLDEIGELPIDAQAKLLRVLETRRIRRLGEEEERTVDFRLVSATNRHLACEVDSGRFRSDLMYRVDGVTIEMPPLSDRREDIPALVKHLLCLGASELRPAPQMNADVLKRLLERPWPGNVRELANEVSRLRVLSDGDIIDPDLVRDANAGRSAAAETSVSTGGPIQTIAELEKRAILDALEATKGDKRQVAALLGISRAKVYQRLKEWGVEG